VEREIERTTERVRAGRRILHLVASGFLKPKPLKEKVGQALRKKVKKKAPTKTCAGYRN